MENLTKHIKNQIYNQIRPQAEDLIRYEIVDKITLLKMLEHMDLIRKHIFWQTYHLPNQLPEKITIPNN